MAVAVLGSINLDVVQRVRRLPRPGETVIGLSTQTFLGGKGANQAVACARMGATTRFLAAVGSDPAGETLLAQLGAYGVDVSRVSTKAGHATGTAHILVSDDGENMIVVSSGANAAVTPADLTAEALAGCTTCLVQLETPFEAVEAFLTSPAGRAGVRILNGAPAAAEAAGLLRHADVVVVNETELAEFAGLSEAPATAPGCAKAARALRKGDQAVVVTLGAAGAVAVTAGGEILAPGRAAPTVVDTTGAGDCFCGALAAALSLGAGLEQALATANAAAAISVTRVGAAPSMPSREEVQAALGVAVYDSYLMNNAE